MSVSSAPSPDRAESARQSLARAQSLLEEALQLIDSHASAPDLGARLHEVIAGLKSLSGGAL